MDISNRLVRLAKTGPIAHMDKITAMFKGSVMSKTGMTKEKTAIIVQ